MLLLQRSPKCAIGHVYTARKSQSCPAFLTVVSVSVKETLLPPPPHHFVVGHDLQDDGGDPAPELQASQDGVGGEQIGRASCRERV